MDAVGVERAALFGESEGGPSAMLLAATHPERCSALILYGSLVKGLSDDPQSEPWRGVNVRAGERLVELQRSSVHTAAGLLEARSGYEAVT